MSVEAAVGPHRELSSGPGVAHPPHRLTRKWAAPRAVLAWPSRSRDISTSPVPAAMARQRVIAPLTGVAVMAGPLLGQSVRLADGGVQVDGQRRIAGSGAGLPCAFPAHPSSWRTWPQRKLRVPKVEGALTTVVEAYSGRPTGSQRIGVVDEWWPTGDQASLSCRRCWPGPAHHPGPGAAVQLGKTEVQGQGGWKEQAGIGHQEVIIEGMRSRWLRGSI